ncbi:tetratricopeptide repeat protein [Methyloterricola oryzae]|uniref:tetratricopeptide repeat protein n=1 Tax=Methyloterricola oryzae TaxID=1495050 RepID=UPI0009E549F8|nr:tetratricopeptide repeat protein [Methyloterricola oryzae]
MSATLPCSRPSLVSTSSVAGFGAALLIALGLTFQNMDQIQRLMAGRSPDGVSIRYLELMTRLNPADEVLRVTLVRQLLQVGQPETAAAALAPLLGKPSGDLELTRLEIEIEQSRVNALRADDPRRPDRIAGLVQRLRDQSGQVQSSQDLAEFARVSLALGQPGLAGEFYVRLSQVDIAQRQRWLQESARWFIASGDSLQAGDRLDEAVQMAADQGTGRMLAIQALDAYVGGMAFDRATARGETYRERFPDDVELLRHLVAMALAAGRPDRARDWGRALAASQPGDAKVLQEQIALELSVSDFRGAWSVASQLARLQPGCERCQEQSAELAEQAGQPGEALRYWLPKVRAGDHGQALGEALRLAQGARNDGLAIELLDLRVQDRALSKGDYFLAEAAYRRSRPQGAWVDFLNRAIARNPNDRLLWEGLIFTLGKNKQSGSLIAALEAMESRFGHSQDLTLRIAQLMSGAGRRDLALQRLRDSSGQFTSAAKDFWTLYGDLAWQLESPADATKAYVVMAEAGSREELVHERLALLARKGGRFDEAIDYAERGWRLSGQPRMLILALDMAAQGKRWDRMGALLGQSAASEPSLARNEQYWLLRARYQVQRGHIADATASYEHLLQINPLAHSARAGLLWMLIDRRDKARLADYVGRWQGAGAAADQALSDALGAAYLALGRSREALDYYERSKQAHKHDPLWLLQYAELLHQSGQIEAAAKLQDFVLRNFRSSLASLARSDKQSAMAYLSLVNQREGAAERYRALEALSRSVAN